MAFSAIFMFARVNSGSNNCGKSTILFNRLVLSYHRVKIPVYDRLTVRIQLDWSSPFLTLCTRAKKYNVNDGVAILASRQTSELGWDLPLGRHCKLPGPDPTQDVQRRLSVLYRSVWPHAQIIFLALSAENTKYGDGG